MYIFTYIHLILSITYSFPVAAWVFDMFIWSVPFTMTNTVVDLGLEGWPEPLGAQLSGQDIERQMEYKSRQSVPEMSPLPEAATRSLPWLGSPGVNRDCHRNWQKLDAPLCSWVAVLSCLNLGHFTVIQPFVGAIFISALLLFLCEVKQKFNWIGAGKWSGGLIFGRSTTIPTWCGER